MSDIKLMNDKIWVVTYYDIAYGEREPTVTCFNNRENAVKYYDCLLGRNDVMGGYYIISIDECEVYTEFKIFE